MKAVIATHCTNEYGDCPAFFVVDVSADLMEKIEKHNRLCANGIIGITADSHEGQWGGPGVEADMRLFGQELVVVRNCVWFQIYKKHQDGHIETESVLIKTLKADFEAGKEIVYYGDDSDELQITYEESLSETQE